MKTSPAGLSLIMRFEGFSPTPYRCPSGWWTIGYGHLIQPKEMGALTLLDRLAANKLLMQDIAVAERSVARWITATLTQQQFDALVSFTFNLGAAALQRSAVRRAVNCGDHDAVPGQLMRWVWGGGRRLPGLIRRRAAEAALYRS